MYSLIIGLFILAGFAAVFVSGRKILQSNKTLNWPHTNATLRHEYGQNEKAAPKIYFTYQVSEVSHEKQIHPSAAEETMPDFAGHFKNKYPNGENITVYYDPDSPENTLFEVGATTENKLIFGFGVGAILMGLYGLTV